MEIQKSRHATHLLHAHLVFVTKYRYKVIKGEHIEYLRKVFTETMEEMGGTLEEFGGEDNHVHLLILYPPKWSYCFYREQSKREIKPSYPTGYARY